MVVIKGDSGGPLIQYVGGRAVLIGIIKQGYPNKCSAPNKKTVFLRVSKIIDWITSVINTYKD